MNTYYGKNATYDDMWFSRGAKSDIIVLHDPNDPLVIVGEEKLDPRKYVMPFGKNIGKRITNIKSRTYLEFLMQYSREKKDFMLWKCVSIHYRNLFADGDSE